jgi:very-short-patch-repair endonuclease/predicted transcriptional regulator of viral defense system
MDPQILHTPWSRVLALAAQQHGVLARAQLLALGLSADGIKHRVRTGLLHPVRRAVYAVGRPNLTRHGRWMAAVLACGPDAVLSHESAAVLWGIRTREASTVEIAVPRRAARFAPGCTVHRRVLAPSEITERHGIPVTIPTRSLLDLAGRLGPRALEAAVNQADKLDLVDPEALRWALDAMKGRPGVPALRTLLDRRTFTLTDSELERRFLQIARKAGLPKPRTQARVNGFLVDFYWPELKLVVETDGLRYHRTPAQQANDRRRDQAHTAAGLTPLRFTHAQVAYEPSSVQRTLSAVAQRRAGAA